MVSIVSIVFVSLFQCHPKPYQGKCPVWRISVGTHGEACKAWPSFPGPARPMPLFDPLWSSLILFDPLWFVTCSTLVCDMLHSPKWCFVIVTYCDTVMLCHLCPGRQTFSERIEGQTCSNQENSAKFRKSKLGFRLCGMKQPTKVSEFQLQSAQALAQRIVTKVQVPWTNWCCDVLCLSSKQAKLIPQPGCDLRHKTDHMRHMRHSLQGQTSHFHGLCNILDDWHTVCHY